MKDELHIPKRRLRDGDSGPTQETIEKIKKRTYNGLSVENESVLETRTLIDDVERIKSNGMDDSLLSIYERNLRELELDLEWNEEENRPISELVLKKGTYKNDELNNNNSYHH